MAMAANGTLEQASINGGAQAPDNCWSTTTWEHQIPTDSGSMEGSGDGGDYNTVRMEWDLKTNPWEWENITMVDPGRQGDGGGNQTRLQGFDWGHVVCSNVESVSSSPALKNSDFSIGLASGSSTPSGVSSVSSGIPGRGVSRGTVSHNDLSSLVKSETDEPTARRIPDSAIEQQRRPFVGVGAAQGCEPGEVDNGASENGGEDNKLSDGTKGAAPSKQRDAFTGLKLGRRTYFEDSAAGAATGGVIGVVGKRTRAPAAPVFSPPGKRQRAMSPGIQTPYCQVEGCKTDSPAKDYHRRHKVCEMHSKASRCIAGGQEQRFCQQCSRFHVLTEFDEGKRSCRRRLAGHNRRRRKARPETRATLSIRGLSPVPSHDNTLTMEDNKQSTFLQHHRGSTSSSTSVDNDEYAGPFPNGLKLSPWSGLGQTDDNMLAASVESQTILSTLLRPTADRLLMLLQSPKGQITAPKPSTTEMAMSSYQFMEGALSPLGQGLSLSSSFGGLLGGFEPTHLVACSQGLSSVSSADSGRALSLLSSQTWVSQSSSCPPTQGLPLGVPQADTTLEQLVARNNDSNNHGQSFSRCSQLQPSGRSLTPQQQKHYSVVEKLLPLHSGGLESMETSQTPQQHYSVVEKLLPLHSGGFKSMETNCGHAGSGNQTMESNVKNDGDQQCNNFLPGGGVYDGANSMLTLLQTRRFGGFPEANSHPTMDLMQTLSAQVQSFTNGSQGEGHSQSQPSSNGSYGEFLPLHPFEGSIYSSQRML